MRQLKFPHKILLPEREREDWNTINEWCTENIGKYREDWFCPEVKDLEYCEWLWAYAFKTEEHATHFKLVWL